MVSLPHKRESRDPGILFNPLEFWIPACAGMTRNTGLLPRTGIMASGATRLKCYLFSSIQVPHSFCQESERMEAKIHFWTLSTEPAPLSSSPLSEFPKENPSLESLTSDTREGVFQALAGGPPSGIEVHAPHLVCQTNGSSLEQEVSVWGRGEEKFWNGRPKENILYQVTILLPAYNEQQAIAQVLQEVVQVMASTAVRYEILVVDDGSTDQTADIAEAFAKRCGEAPIRVVRSPENRGAGAARKLGIRHARGEIIVMLDADGSYPAECIPWLLEYFPQYDQVNGARSSEQGRLPWLRRPAKWFIRKLACYLTGKKIPDLNTGLKAFKRQAMLPWLWVVPDGFSCVTTMTLAFLTNGYAVKYVPIPYRPRIGRSKFHPIRDTAAYLNTVLRMVLYFRPLRVFLPLACLILVFGILKSIGSFWGTGSVQESDIVVLTTGFMTGMLGLLAEVCVAHHRH